MAGGMIPGRGVPLRDRPVAPLKSDAAPRTQVRHCWVTGPAEDPGPWPGLILEWQGPRERLVCAGCLRDYGRDRDNDSADLGGGRVPATDIGRTNCVSTVFARRQSGRARRAEPS